MTNPEVSDNVLETECKPAATVRPKLGFLGVGWIGRHRLEAIVQSGLAEVAALADPAPGQVAQALQLAPEAHTYSSLGEMLEEDLDGLIIATPSAQHVAQAALALEKGLAVFCQKPLARTTAETKRVIEAARSSDRLLGVDLSYRQVTGLAEVRERVRQGDLGKIFAVDAVFHNAYGPDKAWFYDPALSGGGCVIDLGTHLIDLALWMLDFPRVERVVGRLFAQGQPLLDAAHQVEDYATAQMDLASGTTVQLACSWKLSAGCDARIEAAFYGTRGTAALRNINGSFYDFVVELYRGTARETVATCSRVWGGAAALDWVERLTSSRSFDPNIAHLLATAKVVDAIYRPNPW